MIDDPDTETETEVETEEQVTGSGTIEADERSRRGLAGGTDLVIGHPSGYSVGATALDFHGGRSMAGTYEQYLVAVQDTSRLSDQLVTRGATAPTAVALATDDERSALDAAIAVRESYDGQDQEEGIVRSSVLTVAALADLRDAASLLADAELEENGPPGTGALVDVTARGGFVSADMQQMIDDMRSAAAVPAPVQPPGVDLAGFEKDVRTQANAIVETGTESAKGLVTAVAWGSVGSFIDNALDDNKAYQAAKAAVGWLRSQAVRLIKTAFDKLAAAVGADRLKAFIEDKRKDLEEWIDNGGVGGLLQGLFGADDVVAECVQAAKDKNADEVHLAAAVAAATAVAGHAAGMAKVADGVVGVVGIAQGVFTAFGANLWQTPVAPFLAAGFVLAIGAVFWQVQDHLDSRAPLPLPDVTTGLRTSVIRALG